MSASIELIFFYTKKRIDKFQFSFWEKPQNITKNRDIFTIPESVFKYGKNKSQIKIRLFKSVSKVLNDSKDSKNHSEYEINVYYNKNKAYIQLDQLTFKSYEIILKNMENLSFSGLYNEFTEFDTNGNTNKRRLVLINYGETNLYINGIPYDLSQIIPINCNIISSTSYQLSEIDLHNIKFIVKPFESKEESDIKFLEDNKDKYEEFASDLNNLFFCNEKDYKDKLNNIYENYGNLAEYKFSNFHKTKDYLQKLFDDNKFLDTKFFLNFFKCMYFFEYIDDFINNRTITQCFFEKIDNIYYLCYLCSRKKVS